MTKVIRFLCIWGSPLKACFHKGCPIYTKTRLQPQAFLVARAQRRAGRDVGAQRRNPVSTHNLSPPSGPTCVHRHLTFPAVGISVPHHVRATTLESTIRHIMSRGGHFCPPPREGNHLRKHYTAHNVPRWVKILPTTGKCPGQGYE